MYVRTLLAMILVCGAAWAIDEEPTPQHTARTVWAILEAVQKHHVQPPKRAELVRQVLAAAKALDDAPVPKDEQEFLARLAELRKNAPKTPADLSVQAIADTLAKSVPGGVQYLPSSEYKVIEQVNANRYIGTGIQIDLDEDKLPKLIYCFPGGPAHKAGGRHGDVIVAVDGKKVEPGKLGQVVQWLRGDEGMPVTMTVRRAGEKETLDLKMVRSVVPFMTVEGYHRVAEADWNYRVDPKLPIAYLRLDAVRKGTLHELRLAEQRLKANGCRALVLDLRLTGNDSGGDSEAALVADALLERGLLWRVRDARGNVRDLKADADCLFRGWPIVVLAGGTPNQAGNAGALIAAALKDNDRAPLVGELNLANPYLYEFFRLPEDQGVVRLATARVERSVAAAEGPEAKKSSVPTREWLEWRRHQTIGQKLEEPAPADPELSRAVGMLREKLAAATPLGER